MMTRTSLGTGALALALLAALSGCGGSKQLTQTELVAKADPICQHANAALNAVRGINIHSHLASIPTIAAADEQASKELAKLKPPSSLAADWQAIVLEWHTAAEGLVKMTVAAKAHDNTKEMIAYGIFTKAQGTRGTTAQRDNLGQCAKY